MPRKAKVAPTQFLSDDEGEVVVPPVKGSQLPSPPVSDEDDIPPAPKQQPGRLSRVYTLQDDENTPVKGANVIPYSGQVCETPPKVKTNEGEPAKTNFVVDLVTTLAASGANLKGKIDDTGRFELEFELNPTPTVRRRRSSDRAESVSSDGTGSPRAKPGRKTIGWTRS